MSPSQEINQPVDVTAVFRQRPASQYRPARIQAIPLRLSYGGRDIVISQLGLCHPVQHGSQLNYIFDVSDGINDYSLEFNTTTLGWTLLAIIDGSSL